MARGRQSRAAHLGDILPRRRSLARYSARPLRTCGISCHAPSHLADILPRILALARYSAMSTLSWQNRPQVCRKWQENPQVSQHLRHIVPKAAHLRDITPRTWRSGRISPKRAGARQDTPQVSERTAGYPASAKGPDSIPQANSATCPQTPSRDSSANVSCTTRRTSE